MTQDLPAVLPSFVPSDFGNYDSSFKQTPTIDPLKQFDHFYEKANDNSTLIQNTKLVALQQNHESDMTDKRRSPLNIQTPTISTSRESLIDHHLPSDKDDPFGIHDRTNRRSNPMNRNPHSRHKRFVSPLMSLAFDGFKAYMACKRDQKIQKGIHILIEKQKRLDFRIESVENDMMSIAKPSLHEINHMKTTINNTNSRIDFMASRLIDLEESFINTRQETKLNTQGLEYLTNIVGIMIPQIERCLSQYEHIIHELEVLLDALGNLSNGLLSHSVIRPGLLQNFLRQVELYLKVHYPEYELVLDKVEHYYNLSLINFKYDNDFLAIQIPLFVKCYTQQALSLYNLRTVPVPYHINARLSENM